MGAITAWAIRTWFKITVVLGLGVLGVWWFADQPGYTTAAVIVAGLVEVWTVRGLAREWGHEARASWWWSP